MRYSYSEYVLVFKALADETRIRIVELLCDGELCAGQILESFQITQPTLSYHTKILTESGLVLSRRDGPWTRYSINPEKAPMVRCFLEDVRHSKQEDPPNSQREESNHAK